MERTLKLIPLKNILRTDAKYKEIVAAILEQLKDFTDSKYKSNPELVLHIITLWECKLILIYMLNVLTTVCKV